MRPLWTLTVAAAIGCTGCTTVALEQYTRNQNRSGGDCRDSMVLDCLATVAANPETLPSFSLITYGLTTVTDTVNASETTTWSPGKYTTKALGLTGTRQPRGQWTVDPAVEHERLQAMHAACLWALFGGESACKRYPEILGNPQDYLNQKPHFGVAWRLEKIPPGWVHVGGRKDVPRCARYSGHSGHTWVWVTDAETEAFAQFTLALQDIATLDPGVIYSPPLLVTLTAYEVTKIPDVNDPTKAATISTAEIRAVKPEHRKNIEDAIQAAIAEGKPVALTRAQWLAYTEPWLGQRTTPAATPAASLSGRVGPGQLLPVNPAIPTIPSRQQQPPATFKLQ